MRFLLHLLNLVYAAQPGLVIGFHGCDASLVESLINGNTHYMAALTGINNIHQHKEKNKLSACDAVRSTFIEGSALYPAAGLQKNQIRVCI